MPVISIIVPVYKTEIYLRRCICSILGQSFIDFECILVDDGSPDNCPAICDEYAAKDKRVRVIHQKNAGTAYARDAGVKISQGEFLIFVDSDDTIPPYAVQSLYEKQCETGADIVCGTVRFTYNKTEKINIFPLVSLNPVEYILLPSSNCGLCGKVYRRKLYYDGLYIPELNLGEDLIVNLQIFVQIRREKIAFTNSIVYVYDNRTNGITKRKKILKQLSWREYPFISCQLWVYDYLVSNNLFYGRIKDIFLWRLLEYGLLPFIWEKEKMNKNEINIFYNDYFLPCSFKNKIIYFKRIIIPLYKISESMGFLYIRVLKLMKSIKSL